MKKLLIFLVLTVSLFGCANQGTMYQTNMGKVVEDTELFHDFESIDISGGNISHTFSFTNTDEQNLTVYGLRTSCMCTKAGLVNSKGVQTLDSTKRLTDQNPSVILAGEKFDIAVTYDPMAHGPNAVGGMNRSITLFTSSKDNGRTSVFDPESGLSFTQMNIKGEVMYTEDFNSKKI